MKSCSTCKYQESAGPCGDTACRALGWRRWQPKNAQPGVPPGSGGVVLWRCLDDRPGCVCRLYVQRFCMACFRPEHIGVRFPADEKDAGRWYRK